jgi:Fe2+ or Zn2+ uptake regulation protein
MLARTAEGYADSMAEAGAARMEQFKERAVQALKAKGLRITSPRLEVVKVLASSPQALTPYQIHAKVVEKGGQIDVVSVYRILHAFQPLGLVHYVAALDGYLACGLDSDHGPHSKHVVCTSCSRVVEVPLTDEVAALALEGIEDLGFTNSRVQVEVVADSCTSCRTPQPAAS